MNKILVVVLMYLLLSGCSKQELNNPPGTCRINFQNASVELTTMLSAADPRQRARIRWDTISYKEEEGMMRNDEQLQHPFFNNGFGPLSNMNLYMYPNVNYNTQQPWVTYSTTKAGVHQTGVTDTALNSLVTANIDLQPHSYSTVFFTDSAGVFSVVQVTDELQLPAGKIRLRLAHMSPSNDTVTITTGKQEQPAFTDGVRFRQVTPYQDLPLDSAGRITVRLFRKTDPSKVLVRSFIEAVPGRSYTILFKGYTQAVTYLDRNGRSRDVGPNAELFIERMN